MTWSGNAAVLRVETPDGIVEVPWSTVGTLSEGTAVALYQKNPESKPTAKKISAKKTKRASIAQETEVMEALGGRRHRGSGALPGLQGDGKVRDKYRVEMKMTRKEGYRLDRKELSKLRGECRGSEAPLFVVDFVDKETGGSPDRWVLVPFEVFQKLDQHAPHQHR